MPQPEHRPDALPDGRAHGWVGLRGEQRGVLVDRGADLAGCGEGGQPGGYHAAGREPADHDRPLDDPFDEADQVTAEDVQAVAPRRPGGAALTAQIHRVHLVAVGQQPHGVLVAPPGLGLRRDEQHGGEIGITGHGVVHPDLAEVDGLFRVSVRDVDLGVVGGLQAVHWVAHRATAPTRSAVASHSRPAMAGSRPALPGRRMAGDPRKPPRPSGPTYELPGTSSVAA